MTTRRNPIERHNKSAAVRPDQVSIPFASATNTIGFWQTLSFLRPGQNAIRAGFVVLGLSLIYFVLPWAIILGLTIATTIGIVAVAVHEAIVVSRCLSQLKVRRMLPVVIGRDQPITIAWQIENESFQNVVGVLREVMPDAAVPRVITESFQIAAGIESPPLKQVFRIPIRGRHQVGPIWIRLTGTHELIEVQRLFDLTASIKVLPEQFASREELLKDQGAEIRMLDMATRTRQHGAGTEFESLAEFREGDDPRRIDWRATARIQRPVIRRFQIERHRDVMILVDCGRLMGTDTGHGTKLDCAVDAALILSRVVLQSGDRCGMGLYDSEVRGYLPPVAGRAGLSGLTNSVYDLQSNFLESDFGPIFATLQTRQAKRSMIIVISDVVEAETSRQFRASLAKLGLRHIVLFAALRTPLLARVLKEPVVTMVDGAKKAVTFRLLRERQLALQSLKHAGVHVLDIEPSQLTIPLVNQFIQLRQRNLL